MREFFWGMLAGATIMAVALLKLGVSREYKKPMVPQVKIEIIDGKADTTYIYKIDL